MVYLSYNVPKEYRAQTEGLVDEYSLREPLAPLLCIATDLICDNSVIRHELTHSISLFLRLFGVDGRKFVNLL